MSMKINLTKYQSIRMHFQKIGIVLISMLVTFLVAIGPIAKVDGFNLFPWLDIPFHIWGGFLLGMLGSRILMVFEIGIDSRCKILSIESILHKGRLEYAYRYLLYMVAFVIFWGLIWEAWEYWMYVTHRVAEWGGIFDTCKDVFDDMVGAVLAYIYNIKRINKNSE